MGHRVEMLREKSLPKGRGFTVYLKGGKYSVKKDVFDALMGSGAAKDISTAVKSRSASKAKPSKGEGGEDAGGASS